MVELFLWTVIHVYFSKNDTEKARNSCIKLFTIMSYIKCVFSLIQCLLPLRMLFFTPCPISHSVSTLYRSQRPLCYTGEGFYCRGMGKGDTNQGLQECIWFFPVLMLSFKTLHRKFSNSHLENALEVILLLFQNKNLRFTSYSAS